MDIDPQQQQGEIPPIDQGGVPSVPQTQPVPPPVPTQGQQQVPPPVVPPQGNGPAGQPQGGPEWEDTTGNAVLDSSIAVLLKGIGSNPTELREIIGNAVKYNDTNLINQTVVNQKYPEMKDAFVDITKAIIAEEANQVQQTTSTAYAVAGSKENWDSAVSIFNASAPAYAKEAAKAMIDNGNVKEGAEFLMQTVSTLGIAPSQGMPSTSGVPMPSGGGLSYQEMRAELSKLTQEAGGASLESGKFAERYKSIVARREMGRRMGK